MKYIKEYNELSDEDTQKKTCRSCGLLKNLELFNKSKANTDGYNNQCKQCQSDYKKEYFIKNKERLSDKFKTLSEEDKERIRAQKRKSYYLNITEESKEKSRKNRKIYHKMKMDTDLLYKLKHGFQRRLNKSLKRNKFIYSKSIDLLDIIGCSFEEFKRHLESKFENWMTWDNYGKYNGEFNYGWDIDHVIPISTATSEIEVKNLNHYTNLQPLCSKINRDIKRNKN